MSATNKSLTTEFLRSNPLSQLSLGNLTDIFLRLILASMDTEQKIAI